MSSNLPVMECFHSIQGEGAHFGRSAFFIRLALCKVGCAWCDTKESWSSDAHPQISLDQLSDKAAEAYLQGAAFIVLTGGEPLHHNLNPLCELIRKKTNLHNNQSIPIHLETSGVDNLSGNPNWITLSPKPHAPPRIELLGLCQELKVVINQKDDLLFAEEMATTAINARQHLLREERKDKRAYSKPLLFLQPGWKNETGKNLSYLYVKRNPQWRLSMQTHKWLGVL